MLGKRDTYMQKNEIGPRSHTLHKNKLNWTKDLNVRPENIKLNENMGSNLFDTGFSNIFLDASSGKGIKSKNKPLGSQQK